MSELATGVLGYTDSPWLFLALSLVAWPRERAGRPAAEHRGRRRDRGARPLGLRPRRVQMAADLRRDHRSAGRRDARGRARLRAGLRRDRCAVAGGDGRVVAGAETLPAPGPSHADIAPTSAPARAVSPERSRDPATRSRDQVSSSPTR
ncbi:hypothetical protein HBB16_17885 [Pseudonocardia sp. MCCB 268]|nr:hypothetical protein [Pseudonocardia cytotoxica]